MQPVYDYVLESVFKVYLLDPTALEVRLLALDTPIVMTTLGLEFSLPELYRFVCLEAKQLSGQSYQSFRRCLYGQLTQVSLRTLGAEVVIAQNHKHINTTIYRLQALTP